MFGLGIQIVEILELAGDKESLPDVANGALDAALFIAPRHGDGTGLEAMMAREGQKCRMEPDGIALTLKHSALKVVVEQHPGQTIPGAERTGVAAQEVFHAGIKKEAQIDVARVGQHHDEGHQRAASLADFDVTKMRPVDLALLARQGAQTQERFRSLARTVERDHMPEVGGRALVAALLHHPVQAAGGQVWICLKRPLDERQILVDLGGTYHRPVAGQTGLLQNPEDRRMVAMQLRCDRSTAPPLDVVQAQDHRFLLGGYGHRLGLHSRVDGHRPLGGARSRHARTAAADNGSAGSAAPAGSMAPLQR